MEQVKYTTLSQQDIDEHWEFICGEHCIDLFLPINRQAEIADEIVERFIETFLD